MYLGGVSQVWERNLGITKRMVLRKEDGFFSFQKHAISDCVTPGQVMYFDERINTSCAS